MERVYRSLETGLLGLSLCLGLAAFAAMSAPRDAMMTRDAGMSLAVPLPMLSVVTERAP